jgi:hypothetical protein
LKNSFFRENTLQANHGTSNEFLGHNLLLKNKFIYATGVPGPLHHPSKSFHEENTKHHGKNMESAKKSLENKPF